MKLKKSKVELTSRTEAILHLKQKYKGHLDTPAKYNRAFASVLREMADAIEGVESFWVDPEVTVWMHVEGEITAEVSLSPPENE